MTITFQAIYERGFLKPLRRRRLHFPEHRRVLVRVTDLEDVPSGLLAKAAQKSRSYEFLNREREDIYTSKDGKAL